MAGIQEIYERANQAYAEKRFGEAIPLYDQILAAREDLAPQINLNRGACFFQDGQLENAIVAFDAALAGDESMAGAHLNKGKVLERMERFEEAGTSYSRAKELDPSLKVAADIAHCFNAAKQFEMALQKAAEGLDSEPDEYMRLHNERIFAFFKMQNPLGAIDDVKSILDKHMLGELKPEQIQLYTAVLNQKSNSLQEEGKYDEAIEYLEIVDNGNRTADSQYELGLCHLRKGDGKTAIGYLETSIGMDPNNWRYRVALGTSYMRENAQDYNKAAEHLGIALQHPECKEDPVTESSIAFNLSLALMRVGRDDEAVGPLQIVVDKDKNNWIAAGLLGTVYVSPTQEKYAEAIPVLLHAIEASNGQADDSVYYNLAYAYLMLANDAEGEEALGLYKQAAEAFENALRLNPNNENAKNALDRVQKAIAEEERNIAEAEKAAREAAEAAERAAREAAEAEAREKAAKDAAAKKKAQEEREKIEREAREAAERAEEERKFKIAQARAAREKRIKEMELRLGPDRGENRLRRPSLDLIPRGNTAKKGGGYVEWFNTTQATE